MFCHHVYSWEKATLCAFLSCFVCSFFLCVEVTSPSRPFCYISCVADVSKNKTKQIMNKRRKADEEEKKSGMKRLKTETSDLSESSDSENSNKRLLDSSSEPSSESELKGKVALKASEEDEEKPQSCKTLKEQGAISRLSPWEDIKPGALDASTESERPIEKRSPGERRSPLPPPAQPQSSSPAEVQGCIVEVKSTVKTLPKDHYGTGTPRTQTPNCVIDITDDVSTPHPSSRESSEAVCALLASQKCEAYGPETRHLVLNPSASECRKPEPEPQQLGRSTIEFAHSEVIRPVTSVSESAAVAEKEREKAQAQEQYASLAEEIRKPHKLSPSPDVAKSKSAPSPDAFKPLKHNPSPDAMKSKTHSVLEALKPKPNTSPEVSRHKGGRHTENPQSSAGRPISKLESDSVPRSGFKPVPSRVTVSESIKSPLIIDKNEHFTVYRDPALVRPEAESNHVAYLPPHLHPLHGSSHATCLTPSSHHASHLLPTASSLNPHPHPSVHHPLLPAVLPTMSPSSLLGGHPRLDSGGLGHLTLAHHPHPHQQQQQFLQQQPPPSLLPQTHTGGSYNHLGLYPIIWQYPNGTHSYPPGLGLPGSKWVHPDNAVNSDPSLRRVSLVSAL